MKIKKLGDALRCGIIEMNKKENPRDWLNFNAAIIYSAMSSLLSDRAKNKLLQLYIRKRLFPLDKDEIVLTLLCDFKRKFTFFVSQELFSILNEYVIPDWVFENAGELIDLFPNIYYEDEKLYYLNSSGCFRILHENKIGTNLYDMQRHFSGLNILDNDDIFDSEEINDTILVNCSNIFYDEKRGVFYIKREDVKNIYYVYDLSSFQLKIKHNQFIGMINDNPVEIIDGNLVSGSMFIKPAYSYEKYICEGDRIFVRPFLQKPKQFLPYEVFPDSSQRKSHKRAISFMFDLFEADMICFEDTHSLKERPDKFDRNINTVSLKYLCETIEKYYTPSVNAYAKTYLDLFKLLSKYIDQEEDATELLFMLSDVSHRLSESIFDEFINKEVYDKIHALDEEELEKIIKNGELYKKLLEDCYWTDDQIEKYDDNNIFVGYFDFSPEEEFECVKARTKDAINIGSTLMMDQQYEKPGIVTFNIDKLEFEITYSRLITNKERKKIIESFRLEKSKIVFYIEEKRKSVS